ncbi:thiol-disulfide oxidoreductase DCC family protein [Virgibacillus oceani]
MIVYYDGHCSICKTSKSVWQKADWRKKLTFQSFRDLPSYPEAMEKSLHVSHKGNWAQGYQALIEIAKRLPLLWIALPFMYAVKWLGFGEKIYQVIAKNRKVVPVNQCKGNECRIDQ